jgi:integrase
MRSGLRCLFQGSGPFLAERQKRLAAGPVWQESGFVFTRPDGGPLRPVTVSKVFRVASRALGHNLSFHSLRHAAASYLLDAGVPLIVVAGRLGHDPAETARTYGHPQEERERQAAKLAGGLLEG